MALTGERDKRAPAAQPWAAAISLADRAGWDAALEGVPHAFAHTWGYNHALQPSADSALELITAMSPAGRLVCPVTARAIGPYHDLVTPYGFSGLVGSGSVTAVLDAWAGFVAERGYVCGYVGLHPVLAPEALSGSDEHSCHNSVYVLDLTRAPDELYARLSENRRRQLRGWESMQNAITHDRAAVTEFFLANYHDFMRSRNAASVYTFSVETLRRLCALDNVLTLGMMVDGHIAAVSLFGFTPYGAEYLFNVSTPAGQRFSVALIWAAVHALQERGVPWLNLGGGVHEGDALADFKQRFGGDRHALCALKQIYQPATYTLLCDEVGIPADTRDGYFPAYRAGGDIAMIGEVARQRGA